MYDYGDGLLVVATDRISAFDVVLPNGIPDKGGVLNQMSLFWFQQTGHIVPNHVISGRVEAFPEAVQPYREVLDGRAMWCWEVRVLPVECVVRGYLAGSGFRDYLQTGEICGNKLPPGLRISDRLPDGPIFTPATKEEARTGRHDQNIDLWGVKSLVGAHLAERLKKVSLEIFRFASELALKCGLLLCDTKFEFGMTPEGKLILIDELLTPDSSRYWDAEKYEPGRPNEAFDKQFVRDYLETLDWDKTAPGPELPPDVVAMTRKKYSEACRRITGVDLAA